ALAAWRPIFTGVWFILLVLGNTAISSAQVNTASLSGTVADPHNLAIKDAKVTLTNAATGATRTAVSDDNGRYNLVGIPPGQYKMTVGGGANLALYENASVVLTVGESATFDPHLELKGMTQSVTVSAETAPIETTKTEVSDTVEQRRIENLPINGRNYINFTLTNSQTTRDVSPTIGPAPNSGLSIGGARARGNMVNVDGADAVDNSVNGIRSTISQEGVQEFQMIKNGYAAEYGRASGGVVNIISKAGSNGFHGDVYGYLRNRNIQAVNPFSTIPDPAYTRVQAGTAFGGPLRKDRTFYFFSFETTRRHETGFSAIGGNNFNLVSFPTSTGTIQVTPQQAQFIASNATVVDAAFQATLQQYVFLAGASSGLALNKAWPAAFGGRVAFPTTCTPTQAACFPVPASYVPLNSILGNFPVFEGTSVYSLRLDHRLTNSNSAMLRIGVSPSTADGIQVNAQGPAQTFGQNSLSRTSSQTYRDFSTTAQDTWT